MKSREEIARELFINRPENKNALALNNIVNHFIQGNDSLFAYKVFKILIQNEIYLCPLNNISNQDIATYYDKVIEKARKELTVINPIFEQQENHIFLKRIKDGTVAIYNALNDNEKFLGNTLLSRALAAYSVLDQMNTEEIRTTIIFVKADHCALTFTNFMESQEANVITEISEAFEENTLYSYLYAGHWYLVGLEEGMYNVIDIRGKSVINKKLFMDGHQEIAEHIVYIDKFSIQPAVEKAIKLADTCGRVVIAIHNHYISNSQVKPNQSIEDYFSELKSSLKENYEFYKDFMKEIALLSFKTHSYIKDDYSVFDGNQELLKINFKEHPSNMLDNLSCVSAVAHSEFVTTIEHSNNGFLADNWNLIKYITFGLTILAGLYVAYDSYFNNNGTVDTGSVEHLIGDILSHEEI